jgi:hypothetical protein
MMKDNYLCDWHCKHEHMKFQTCPISKKKKVKIVNDIKNYPNHFYNG